MISTNQKYRVIRSRTDHHPAHKNNALVSNTEARQAGYCNEALCNHHGHANCYQWQHHGDRIPVDDQQNDQQQDRDRKLDATAVPLPGEVQIGDGGRGPGQVSRQCRACDLVFDDVSDAGVRLLGLGRTQVAGKADRQDPGLIVFAGHELPQAVW